MSGHSRLRRNVIEAVERNYIPSVGRAGMAVALARLTKPGIVAAVILAGFAGMVTAARGLPEPETMGICLATLLLASAGSAMLNGILDAPQDRSMERLRERVRALDAVGTPRLFCVALASIAVALSLALTLNRLVFFLILAAVILYSLVYTLLLKRCSPWGAIPGGIPGALPVLIGQAAVTGSLEPASLILFTIILLWQPPHFWALALQYQEEYRAAGIPVLPVACGETYTRGLILLYATALLPATLVLPMTGCCSPLFGAAAATLWLYFVAACYRHAIRARRFGRAFTASILYLAGLLSAVILDLTLLR